jgi:8-oxo-dGTP pyrophosphatase MutT (NUDIX family)
MVAAGILPTAWHNNQLYFLFGKEQAWDETPGFADFGGGQEKGESLEDTASREGAEELTGFLGSEPDIRRLLRHPKVFPVDMKNPDNPKHHYRTYVVPCEYNTDLPRFFNNNQRFLRERLTPAFMKKTHIFEKEEIRWFRVHELLHPSVLAQFRPFYREMVSLIHEQREAIQKKLFSFRKQKTMKKGKGKRKTLKRGF